MALKYIEQWDKLLVQIRYIDHERSHLLDIDYTTAINLTGTTPTLINYKFVGATKNYLYFEQCQQISCHLLRLDRNGENMTINGVISNYFSSDPYQVSKA